MEKSKNGNCQKMSDKEKARQNNRHVHAKDFRDLQESFIGDSETSERVYC